MNTDEENIHVGKTCGEKNREEKKEMDRGKNTLLPTLEFIVR